MHILILGKRRSAAQKKISTIAQALAEKLELDPTLIKGLKVQEKNVEVRTLKEQEAIANLLAEVAVALGIELTAETPIAEIESTADRKDEVNPDSVEGVTAETDEEALPSSESGEGLG